MSEEQAAEEGAEGLDQQVEQQPEQQEQPEQKSGHISKEDWIAKGRDPEDWRSPEVFEERGRWIKETDSLKQQIAQGKQETDVQIRNLNQLHQVQSQQNQAQLQQRIVELESKRNDAISEADTEQANQIQGQIDQARNQQFVAQAQEVQQAPAKDQAVADWETKNQWVMNPNDPKTPYANQQFMMYQNQGYTPAQAIQMVEGDVARAFPNVNAARQGAAAAEGGSPPGGKRSASVSVPTWEQLSHQEKAIYESMPDAFGTQQDFLKAVANDRKGA